MYENTIQIARPHASHVCESMPHGKTRETSMLVHLQINYRKQIKTFVCQVGFVKEKHIFSRLAFVYVLSGRLKSRKWKQHTRSGL